MAAAMDARNEKLAAEINKFVKADINKGAKDSRDAEANTACSQLPSMHTRWSRSRCHDQLRSRCNNQTSVRLRSQSRRRLI